MFYLYWNTMKDTISLKAIIAIKPTLEENFPISSWRVSLLSAITNKFFYILGTDSFLHKLCGKFFNHSRSLREWKLLCHWWNEIQWLDANKEFWNFRTQNCFSKLFNALFAWFEHIIFCYIEANEYQFIDFI